MIWIVNDLRKDLLDIKKTKSATKKGKEPSYINSIGKVLFADIMISFDNVIGVVAAAKGYCLLGCILVILMDSGFYRFRSNH